MKKQLPMAAAAILLATIPVLASASSLEGFSVAADVESERASVDATDGASDSATTTGLGLQLRYDMSLAGNFLLGIGATFSIGNRQAGTYASRASAYTNNRLSIDLTPGYALTGDTVAFVKISSNSATAAADDNASTTAVQGMSYGLGLRSMISDHAYWQASYDSYRFNDATFGTGTTASLRGNIISLGLGYKF